MSTLSNIQNHTPMNNLLSAQSIRGFARLIALLAMLFFLVNFFA
jgi:hypothetical protein